MLRAALLGSLLALAAAPSPEPDEAMPSSSVKKIVDSVRDNFDSYFQGKFMDAGKAEKKIADELEKVEKKVEEPLRLIDEWRAIFRAGNIPEKPLLKPSTSGRFSSQPGTIPSPIGWNPESSDAKHVFDGEMKIFISAPRDYAKVDYPVILGLHPQKEEAGKPLDEMEGCSDLTKEILAWAEETYPAELLARAIVVVPVADFVTLSPTGDTGTRIRWDSPDGLGILWLATALRSAVLQNIPHDPARLYLDGYGTGGTAALTFCADYPSVTAGAIIRGPVPENLFPRNLSSSNLMLVGEETKEFFKPWSAEFSGIHHSDALDAAALGTFVEESRKTYCPEKVQLWTREKGRSAYWVAITDTDRTAATDAVFQVIAQVDREKNEITLEVTPDVTHVDIYVNDALLDLDRNIRVLCRKAGEDADQEAEVRFEGTCARDLHKMLDYGRGMEHGNVGEVFVNKIGVDF